MRKEGKGYIGRFKTIGSEYVFSFPTGNADTIKNGILSFGTANAVALPNKSIVVNVGKPDEPSPKISIGKLKDRFKKKAAEAKKRLKEMKRSKPWTDQDTKGFYSGCFT